VVIQSPEFNQQVSGSNPEGRVKMA
jgi:hypothetical protein